MVDTSATLTNDYDESFNAGQSSKKVNYQPFYPDSLSVSEWVALDFSQKQAEAIINFKNSSGGFKEANDLKKVYVISDEKFEELLPYMRFASSKASQELFELNSANENQLKSIPGIGDVLSKRIVKYRNSIGGFTSYSDLEKVYGLENEVINNIKANTTLAPRAIEKINVNVATKEELTNLPYLDFEIVSLILKERDKSRLKNLNFIPSNLLNDKEKGELNQYLEFN